jgi:hypothetical protein
MVNYLYDLKRMDKHRSLLAQGKVPVSGDIDSLCRLGSTRRALISAFHFYNDDRRQNETHSMQRRTCCAGRHRSRRAGRPQAAAGAQAAAWPTKP